MKLELVTIKEQIQNLILLEFILHKFDDNVAKNSFFTYLMISLPNIHLHR
jgi:hypothetical protein